MHTDQSTLGPKEAGRGGRELRTMRDFVYVIFRRLDAAILAFVVVLAPVILYALLASSTYRSEAKVLVRIGRESVGLDPTTTTGATVSVSQSRLNEINSELEIMRSAELLAETAEALRLFGYDEVTESTSPEKRARLLDNAVRELAEGMRFSALEDTNVIAMSFDSKDADTAHAVVNDLLERFLVKHAEVHRTPGARRFFQAQTDELAARLQEAEDALRAARDETGVVSIDVQRSALLGRLDDRAAALEDARSALLASRARVKALEELIAELPENVVLSEASGLASASSERLKDRLVELRLQEQDLAGRYHEDTFVVQTVREQIKEIESLVAAEDMERREVTAGLNVTRRTLELSLLEERAAQASLESRVSSYEDTVASLRNELVRLNGFESRLASLARDRALAEQNYHRYVEGLEMARIDQALEDEKISNISVFQPATRPAAPVGPKRAFIVLVGLFLAAAVSLGAAFVLELIDDSVRTPDEAREQLDVSVLATLPRSDEARLARPSAGGWQAPLVLSAGCKNVADGVRALASEVGAQPLLIAISGNQPGAGASTIAATLGASLAAEPGNRVLLVDARFENPALTRQLADAGAHGLSDLLARAGRRNLYFHPLQGDSLALLTAGTELDAARDFDPTLLAGQLRSWGAPFTHVLVDMPPPLEVRWTLFAAACDGTILVVDAGRSRWPALIALKKSLMQAGTRILGVVLNKREFPIPDWLYQRL